MDHRSTLDESLHRTEYLKNGDVFLEYGKPCTRIGKLISGVMRGFVYNDEGDEITTHFYQEGDVIIGSYIPNISMTMTIQAMEDCEISIADYAEVMSWVNKDREITEIITREFQKLNDQLQSRLVSLLNLSSVEKYELFLKEYPNLINRIPHYYVANYLGITPTQLSRARKQFIDKCK
ncbi:cyclic nucleotide-binding domain-containing protein [Leptobacterium flavescens]|uniref:Cyclic nucleotide-binding domain-containing protein n=1 Tax=Leptobacterium flavescens TaxID=472055 RepID=A0A6P0UJB1_9FLAO|nr:Crp/Fnr family transcriptional regulator [Leptobacterium flavescens]NER13461.1 cyclic nucleotide-binding domain-containing protein [Leptobacterium flavescens]